MIISYHLLGVSRSTERTFFYIPEFNIGLDAGTTRKNLRPDVILHTHAHDDHSVALPYLAQQEKTNKNPILIYCNLKCKPYLDNWIKAAVCCEEERKFIHLFYLILLSLLS
jgi:mRNA degradation ribonuclease J1/J2